MGAASKGFLTSFATSWLGVVLATVFFGIPSMFFLVLLHNRFQAVSFQRMTIDVGIGFLLPLVISLVSFLLNISCLGCIFVALALVQFVYLLFIGWRWDQLTGD
jgi:hypothetical protein